MAHPHWRADLYCKQLEPKGEVTKVESMWRGHPPPADLESLASPGERVEAKGKGVHGALASRTRELPEIIEALALTSPESPPPYLPDFDPHPARFPPPAPQESQIDWPEAFPLQNAPVLNLAADG